MTEPTSKKELANELFIAIVLAFIILGVVLSVFLCYRFNTITDYCAVQYKLFLVKRFSKLDESTINNYISEHEYDANLASSSSINTNAQTDEIHVKQRMRTATFDQNRLDNED